MNAGLTHGQLWLLEGLVAEARGVANPSGRGAAPEALSAQQLGFVDAYLVTLSAVEAARRAGYSNHTARQQGARLLSNVAVKAEIRRRLEILRAAAQVTVEGVLEQLRRLAFADIRDLYRDDGTFIPVREWPDDISTRILGVETEEIFAGRGEDREAIGRIVKVKLVNPNEALKTIATYLKMLVNEGSGSAGMTPAGAIDADFETLTDEELRERAMVVAMKAMALPPVEAVDAPGS